MESHSGFSRAAFASLLLGAGIIAFSGILVRLSPVGPIATGFYRFALAFPVMLAGALVFREKASAATAARAPRWALVLPGLFFGCDNAIWNTSLHMTTVSNSTLFANLAPICVTFFAWLLFRERITRLFLVGLAAALFGAFMLMWTGLQLGTDHLIGDLLACSVAFFYGGYQLSITRLRRTYSTLTMMVWTCLVASGVLLTFGLLKGEAFLWGGEAFWHGLAALLGLSLVCQCCGQGCIVYAMKRLPASFSSLSLLSQPVIATLAAWVLFKERLGLLQMAGAAIVLFGIALAHRATMGAARVTEECSP